MSDDDRPSPPSGAAPAPGPLSTHRRLVAWLPLALWAPAVCVWSLTGRDAVRAWLGPWLRLRDAAGLSGQDLDLALHVAGSAVLGAALAWGLQRSGSAPRLLRTQVLAGLGLLAFLTALEALQQTVPTRGAGLGDALANALGGAIGYAASLRLARRPPQAQRPGPGAPSAAPARKGTAEPP